MMTKKKNSLSIISGVTQVIAKRESYPATALSEDSAAEGRSTISGKGRRFDSCTSPSKLNIAIGKDVI